MFSFKYKDVPDSDNNTFYVTEDDIVLIPQKNEFRWTIFALCDKVRVEVESLNLFLATSLTCNELQIECLIMVIPKPSIEEE